MTANQVTALRLVRAGKVSATMPVGHTGALRFDEVPGALQRPSLTRAVNDLMRSGLVRAVPIGSTSLFEHFRADLTPEGVAMWKALTSREING